MPPITKGSAKILVTGANGYIAFWIVRYLLEDGYEVIGTVRAGREAYVREYFEKHEGGKFKDKLRVVVVNDITQVCPTPTAGYMRWEYLTGCVFRV